MVGRRKTLHSWPAYLPILAFAAVVGLVCLIVFRPVSKNTFDQARCSKSLSARITAADVVMTGSVFMVIPGGSAGTQVIMDPITIYKGQLDKKTAAINAVDVLDSTAKKSTDRSELHFQSGQPPYLLFLRRQDDGSYNTRACDGSRLFGDGLTNEEQVALQSYAGT